MDVKSRKSIRTLVVGSCSSAFSMQHGELSHVKEIIADKILISNNYLKCDFQIREYQYKIVIADTLRHYCIERYLCVA